MHQDRLFFKYFDQIGLPQELISTVWTRLRLQGKLAPRNYVLAAICQLHFETWVPDVRPKSMSGLEPISKQREGIISCFGEWVSCRCRIGCLMEWCFVSTRWGMHREYINSSCLVYKQDPVNGENARLRTEIEWNKRKQQPVILF